MGTDTINIDYKKETTSDVLFCLEDRYGELGEKIRNLLNKEISLDSSKVELHDYIDSIYKISCNPNMSAIDKDNIICRLLYPITSISKAIKSGNVKVIS